jgi:HD-GYP domain-containing protein (c-di-GMP phosphodiesterase class II)/CHASE2 domain-containing sensor protein
VVARARLYDWTVALLLTLATALLAGTAAIEPVRRVAADALLRLANRHPPALAPGQPDALIVAIDPQSLRAVPDWPWSRHLHAEAVRRLHAAGAKAIAFDVDFSSPRDAGADAAFADAIGAAGNVLLAAFRQLQPLPGGAELEIANLPIPRLADAARGVGSVHMEVDPDGVLRRSPRSVEIGGRLHASLAETTLDMASGRAAGAPRRGSLPVDYRRAEPPVPVIPIIDVLEGRFDPRDVAGRAVLIGATAVEFQDLWSTPLGPARPGVWIQAIALRTLAAERAGASVLVHAGPAAGAALACALLLAAAAAGRRDHARRLLATLLLAAACAAGIAGLLVTRGVLFDPVAPMAALAVQHVVGLERVRRRFGAQIALREQSIAALARVGEVTTAPAGDAGLGVALALLGDVVDASGVALLRASAARGLDGRRFDWQRRGSGEIGDEATAEQVLAERRVRIFEGALPGRGASRGVAVYSPLHAGDVPIGVLVVERERTEPLDATQLRTIATVGTQLALSAHNLRLLDDLRTTFDSSIEAIASAVEARDGYTQKHCRRLASFSTLMAHRLGLGDAEIEAIRLGALLHDVGKVGIRDEILLKPGRFTDTERGEMQRHAAIGHGIISGIHGLHATTLACVRHHHERWDGSGYPDRLPGDATPLGARIVAVVDVWDALSTARPYKPALAQDRVRDILRKDRGSHLDPALVDLFLALLEQEGDDLLAMIDRAERRA